MKDEERRKENETELIWKERMRTSSCRKDMYSSSTLPLPHKHKETTNIIQNKLQIDVQGYIYIYTDIYRVAHKE